MGLVVIALGAVFPLVKIKYRQFEIRFVRLGENSPPTVVDEGTSLALKPRRNIVFFGLRPRSGIELTEIGIQFFDNAGCLKPWLPYSVGKHVGDSKNSSSNINMYHWRDDRWEQITDLGCRPNIVKSKTIHEVVHINSLRIFKVVVVVDPQHNNWDGIMSLGVDYIRSGNHERGDVHSKIYLEEDGRRKPIAHAFKHVIKAAQ